MTDGDGLYLLINPNGGKWRRFDGKRKTLSMGVYPQISLRDARDRRDAARKQIANGIDPGEHRKAHKNARADAVANSFEAIACEWFTKMLPTWSPDHADKIIKRFERDVFPWIGGKPIADLKAADVLNTVRRQAIKKGDLIISARGTVGAMAQLDKPMSFNQSCYGLRPKTKVSNDYIFYAFSHEIQQLKSQAYGSKFDAITIKTFDEVRLPVPPEEIQSAISIECDRIDKLQTELQRKSASNLQTIEADVASIYASTTNKRRLDQVCDLSRGRFFTDSVVGLMPNDEVMPRFLELMLRAQKKHLNEIAPQLAQKNINLEILKPLLIPVAPLSGQKKLIARIEALEKQITEAQAIVDGAAARKQPILQKYL